MNKKLLLFLPFLMLASCGNKEVSSKIDDEKLIIEASVSAITSAIDSIESKDDSELINAISDAFASLNIEDKKQVTNYNTLFNYQKELAMSNGLVKGQFIDSEIVRRIGVVSDTHNSDNVVNAFNILNNWDGEGMDTLVMAGDITDGVRYYDTGSWEIPKAKNLYLNNLPEDLPIVMALGNHDTSNASHTSVIFDGLGPRFYSNVEDMDLVREKGISHAKIGDYHFITLECDYDKESLTKDAEIFLEETMKKITESPDYHGEYIFIVNHLIPYQTCVTYSQSNSINNILKYYPQAFVIAGHSHNPITDERNIMQTHFTAMNPGSVSWLYPGNTNFLETNSSGVVTSQFNQYNSYDLPQGSLIEIDCLGNLRINRIDFRGDEGYIIRDPWILSAPKNNNSHLFSYPKDRASEAYNDKPYFSNEPWAKLYKDTKDKDYLLEFSSAHDDGFIFYYDVCLIDSLGNTLKSFKTLSEFYLYANTDNMPESKTVRITSLDKLPSILRIKAVDNFDASTNTIDIRISMED